MGELILVERSRFEKIRLEGRGDTVTHFVVLPPGMFRIVVFRILKKLELSLESTL